MRAHGFGERVVLGTDIYEIFTKASRRLVRERLFKTAVLRSSRKHLFYGGTRLNRGARLLKTKRTLEADQSGIVAQIFLLCGKVRLEFFREGLI